jgi:hypothetical protein
MGLGILTCSDGFESHLNSRINGILSRYCAMHKDIIPYLKLEMPGAWYKKKKKKWSPNRIEKNK